MSDSNILVLFAPKFKDFGCDLAKEYLLRKGGGKIHGLTTGPIELLNEIKNILGSNAGKFWHLTTEESKWITEEDTLSNHLCQIDEELGKGKCGQVIISDRRIGRGFVRGGLSRPDNIANLVKQDSITLPQKYVNGLYQFLDKLLKETKPDCVFCYAVAGAPAFLLAEMCNARGISFSRFTSLRTGNRMTVDSDPKGKLLGVAKTFKNAVQKDHQLIEERKIAHKLLKEFREKPTPPEYMQRKSSKLRKRSYLKSTIKALKSTAVISARALQTEKFDYERLNRIWFKVWTDWNRALISKKTFAKSIPNGFPFIYYPLHVDPEASTMVLSPWHTDQINVIEALAKSAPGEMCIVVKEHSPMLGKRPYGFYKAISRIPRVALLGPEQNGMSLIQKAELVAVITGTAAWEAIRLRKPTLIIGDSPFLAIGEGIVHEPCLSKLHEAIPRAIQTPPATDEVLELYIAAGLSESFEMPSSLLWEDYYNHATKTRKEVVCRIVDKLI